MRDDDVPPLRLLAEHAAGIGQVVDEEAPLPDLLGDRGVEDEVAAAVQRERGGGQPGHEAARRRGARGRGGQEGDARARRGRRRRRTARPRAAAPSGDDGEERQRERDGHQGRRRDRERASGDDQAAPGQARARRHAGRAQADDGEEAGAQHGGADAHRRPRAAAVDLHAGDPQRIGSAGNGQDQPGPPAERSRRGEGEPGPLRRRRARRSRPSVPARSRSTWRAPSFVGRGDDDGPPRAAPEIAEVQLGPARRAPVAHAGHGVVGAEAAGDGDFAAAAEDDLDPRLRPIRRHHGERSRRAQQPPPASPGAARAPARSAPQRGGGEARRDADRPRHDVRRRPPPRPPANSRGCEAAAVQGRAKA